MPSAENPADLPSRGIKADDKESWRRFHEGPEFLRQPRSEWPQMPCDMAKIENDEFGALLESVGEESDAAADGGRKVEEVNSAIAKVEKTPLDLIHQVATRTSSWKRLIARLAYLRRFCEYVAGKKKFEHGIVGTEMLAITRLILNSIKQRHFAPEMASLMASGGVPKSSRLARLNPFLDSESPPPLIRVGGRIHRRGGDFNHPIILPRESKIVALLIRHKHEM